MRNCKILVGWPGRCEVDQFGAELLAILLLAILLLDAELLLAILLLDAELLLASVAHSDARPPRTGQMRR